MTVQQGKLGAVDTTVDMEDFYADAVVENLDDVDRVIHDGIQYVRLKMQIPQPTLATRGTTSGTLRTTSDHYIDSTFSFNSVFDINLITIGFQTSDGGVFVSTNTIEIYEKTGLLSTTLSKWTVSTSLDNSEAQFSNANFKPSVTAVSVTSFTPSVGPAQFKYTITIGAIPISSQGMPYWRITHQDAGAFNEVTEVVILGGASPQMTFFDTAGNAGASKTIGGTANDFKMLDMCWDVPTGVFYGIRFNSNVTGTTTVTLNDNFSDASAGTVSGTGSFNPSRWTESTTNTQFVRSSGQLLYSVSTGKGQIETKYTLSGALGVILDVLPTTVTSNQSWLAMRALDSSNNTVMSEGVGRDLTTTSGAFFSSYISNLVDTTAGACEIREIRPQWHNTTNGTEQFSVLFEGGSSWSVSGTSVGGLADATTGVSYTTTIAPSTPVEFILSANSTPGIGNGFTFNIVTASGKKAVTATGIIGLARSAGNNWTTSQILTSPTAGSSAAVTIEIFGNTNTSTNIAADNYTVAVGTGNFSDVATFTVEKFDQDGLVVGSPLINSFDVIGDASKTYNDFLNGRVQIACTSSGNAAGGFIYLKIDDALYKYANNITLGTETGSSAIISTVGQIARNGTVSLNWTHASGAGGVPFLVYLEYDDPDAFPSGADLVQIKTINHTTLQDTSDSKELFLNITDYSTSAYKVFFHQIDFDTLYYVDSSSNLRAWNVDDRISAFIAVNAEDVTLPAGSAQQTDINADVINAWGEALEGKTVTFAVTAGDGAVAAATDTTDSAGRATTQYIVGSTVGVSVVTATVTESA